MGTMTLEAQKQYDDYFKNRIPPGKLIMTPELEAAFNSPYYKKRKLLQYGI